jgi:hypothetical protein
MERGLQPRDRRQAGREHRSGSPLSNMVASRAACLNRVQGAVHRVFWAHFDNRECQAGMDLCIYCDLGFEFRFSPPIWGVVDPRGGVAKWLADKAFQPFGRLVYGGLNGISNAIGYAEHYSRSHYAVIRVYDESGNVIEMHEHKGDFREWWDFFLRVGRLFVGNVSGLDGIVPYISR